MAKVAQDCEKFYGAVGTAVGVYTDGLAPVYVNPAFLALCRLGVHEFGSAARTRAELEASFVQHRNKRSGTIRFAQPDGESRVVHIAVSTLTLGGRSFRVYTLWGPPAAASYVDPDRRVFIFGELRVNVESRAAFHKRRLIPLTEREFSLLAYLAANEDRLLSKAELLKEVWGQRAQGTRTLDVYVSRLKAKLRQAGLKSERIRTQHGQGYLFVSAL